MSLKKRTKTGGGRKKLKREGGLKDNPVGIGVWGSDKIEKIEALLRHRESNLARAIRKGYHPSAIGRYQKEIQAAKRRLEELALEKAREDEQAKRIKEGAAAREMRKALLRMKERLENRPLK